MGFYKSVCLILVFLLTFTVAYVIRPTDYNPKDEVMRYLDDLRGPVEIQNAEFNRDIRMYLETFKKRLLNLVPHSIDVDNRMVQGCFHHLQTFNQQMNDHVVKVYHDCKKMTCWKHKLSEMYQIRLNGIVDWIDACIDQHMQHDTGY